MLVIPESDRDVLYTRGMRHSKSVTNRRGQTRLHLVFKTFLRYPADVSFADKRLKYVSQTSWSLKRMVHWVVLFGIPESDFILTIELLLQFKNTYGIVNGLSVED